MVCFSCGDKFDNPVDSDPVVIQTLSTDFEIILQQRVSTNGSFYQLRTQLIEGVDCDQTMMSTVLDDSNSDIKLNINLSIPPFCNGDPLFFPFSVHPLDPITESTSFNITINDEFESKGIIELTNEQITITFEESIGIEFPVETLNTIPTDIMWGYYDTTGLSPNANGAVNSKINQATNPYGAIATGDYGLFSITQNQKLSIPDVDDNLNFVIRSSNEQSWSDLEAAFVELKSEYPGLSFKMYNWNGEILE